MHFPLRAIPSLFFLSPSLLTSPVFESLQYCDAVGVSFPLRSGRDLRRHLTTASGTPFASHDLPDHLRKYSRFHPIHNVHRIDDAEDAVPAVRVLDEVSVEHDDASVTAPLFQGMGTHYADVWVGTPPQRKSVIVDTGSHYTAFPCVVRQTHRRKIFLSSLTVADATMLRTGGLGAELEFCSDTLRLMAMTLVRLGNGSSDVHFYL